MANGRSQSARRREVRRTIPRPGPKWMHPLRHREGMWVALYVALFTLLASLVAIPDGARDRYEVGQVVSDPITSRVDFETVDYEETEQRRTEAQEEVPRHFTANEGLVEALEQQLEGLGALAEWEDVAEVPADAGTGVELTQEELDALREQAAEPTVGEAEGEEFAPSAEWEELTREFLQGLFRVPIVDSEAYRAQQEMGGQIVMVHPFPEDEAEREMEPWVNQLIDIQDQEAVQSAVEGQVEVFPEEVREPVVEVVLEQMQPTYEFDEALTDERREMAYEAVEPEIEEVEINDTLVGAGETIDQGQLELLQGEREAYWAQQSVAERWMYRGAMAGLMLVIGLGIWLYVLRYNERVIHNPTRAMALMGVLIGGQVVAVVLTQLYPQFIYNTAVFPTLLAAIVITIAYGQRFALGLGVLHALLVVVTLDLPTGFALVLLTGVGVAVGSLHEVRSRSTVVGVGVWSGLAMATVTLMMGVVQRPLHLDGVLERIGLDALNAAGTGIVAGLFVQGILPGIEKAFKVTTAMTLRELNDASHPLLKRLAQEAPGTYQHSLRIADMAEAGAEAVGGNSLLCRVGALYHDIGKINKPMYFIENQSGGPNRHNKLSPAMSLLIIVGHVKDGIEMAREYRLPASIRHFIESHHGTTLVEYFYHAARKQKEAEEVPGPSEFEFRYPGPKPQTKEAAVMLLCDSVEAAARSLPEPTPVRLEQIVHRMANKRLMDGQFDECNLTLQELHRIEEAITKMLCAIYHGRVKYPGQGGAGTAAAGSREPQPRPAAQSAAS